MKKLVFVFAMLAMLTMAAGAWAANDAVPGPSVTVNGRITTELGYQNLSKELTTNKKDDVTTAFVNVTSGSYLRATFTSADKTTGGLIELSVASSAGSSESTGLRFAYGWWKVGNCKLVAGQTDNWLGSMAYAPSQVLGDRQSTKENLRRWGYVYSGRNPQINFQWQSGNFGFMIAAVQPGSEKLPTVTGADTYASLPRFDAAVEFKAGGFSIAPGAGWSQVKFQGVTMGDDSATQWVAMVPMKFTTGPLTIKLSAHTGNNIDLEWSGQKLSATRSLPISEPIRDAKGKITDTKTTGGALSLEYKITDALSAGAGYGMEKHENDYWKQSNGYKNEDFSINAWYINFPYQVTKNFTLTPEVSYYNYGDSLTTGKDNGNEWLAGFQFRFVF